MERTVSILKKNLNWGSGVLLYRTRQLRRETFYPAVCLQWKDPATGQRKRLTRRVVVGETDRAVEHELSLKAAELRAELTGSTLDIAVLQLEYDLDASTLSRGISYADVMSKPHHQVSKPKPDLKPFNIFRPDHDMETWRALCGIVFELGEYELVKRLMNRRGYLWSKGQNRALGKLLNALCEQDLATL